MKETKNDPTITVTHFRVTQYFYLLQYIVKENINLIMELASIAQGANHKINAYIFKKQE